MGLNLEGTEFDNSLDTPIVEPAVEPAVEPHYDPTPLVLESAMNNDPQTYKQMEDLAKSSGIPQNLVELNPEKVKKKQRIDDLDINGFKEISPVLHQWLGEYGKASKIHNNVKELSALETLFVTGNAVATAPFIIEEAAWGIIETFPRIASSIAHPFAKLAQGVFGYRELPADPFTIAADTAAEFARRSRAHQTELLKDIKHLPRVGQDIISGIQSTAVTMPALLTMLRTGNPQLFINIMGGITYGTSVSQALDKGVDVDKAIMLGVSNAALEKWTESLSVTPLLGMMKSNKKLLNNFVEFALKDLGGELINTTLSNMNNWAILPENESKTFMDYALEQPDAWLSTLISTTTSVALQSATVRTAGYAADKIAGRLEAAENEAFKADRLFKGEQNKLERIRNIVNDPDFDLDDDTLSEFIDNVDADGEVFLDAEIVEEYLNQKSYEEVSGDEVLNSLREKLDSRESKDIDIQVPMKEFVSKVVKSEHYNQLADHVKLSAEADTPHRREQGKVFTEKSMKKLIEKGNLDAKEVETSKELFNNVKAQLIDTGRMSKTESGLAAEFIPSFVAAYAKDKGMTFTQAYESMYNLKIEGPATGKRDTLADAGILKQIGINTLEDLIKEFENHPISSNDSRMTRRLLELTNLDKDAGWTDSRLASVVTDNQSADGQSSRVLVAFVDPAEFVNATHDDPQVIADEAGSLDIDKLRNESQTPFLVMEGDKIIGHEGRHRMAALNAAGVHRVPIKIVNNNSVFDSADKLSDNFKLTLKGQHFLEAANPAETLVIDEAYMAVTGNIELIQSKMVSPDVLFQRSSTSTEESQIVFEVAPNPDDHEASLEWGGLDSQQQYEVTSEVVEKITPLISEHIGVPMSTVEVLSGFEGATSQGITLKVSDPLSALSVAKLIGNSLEQKGVLVVSETPAKGFEQKGLITVKIPTDFNQFDVQKLYESLASMTHEGESIIKGHITSNGQMSIVNTSLFDNVILADMIDAQLGKDAYDIESSTVYVAYPTLGDYNDNSTQRTSQRQPSSEGNFRSNAELRSAIIQSRDSSVRRRLDENRARRAASVGEGTLPQTERRAHTRESDGSLKGLPRIRGARGSYKIQKIAEEYVRSKGLEYNPPSSYAKVDVERAKRIADEYDKVKHNPQDPEAKASYDAMISETLEQYQFMLDNGFKSEFVDEGVEYNYEENPRMMIEDVVKNNHAYVFSTRNGYGSDESFRNDDSPMLAETNFIISGQTALVNDIFRVVHDYFGHVKEGVGFRADGEENAWRSHSAMYSPLARRAVTTETRGQNSWVNYGPHGEKNRTAKGEDTVFATQKIGVMPEWVGEEDVTDSVLFQQGDDVNGYYDPANTLIRLTESSNASTFLHEFAHFMYDMELKFEGGSNHVDSLNEWFVRNVDDLVKEVEGDATEEHILAYITGERGGEHDSAINTALHEHMARGFEAYIMEGKAPTSDLRKAFRYFSQLMLEVYKRLKFNSPKLDDDVRKVFARLIATEEQIQAAEIRTKFEPAFTEQNIANMSDEEWLEYQSTVNAVKDKASETLRDKLIKQLKRETKDWWKSELDDIKIDKKAELSKNRVHAARTVLRSKDDNSIKLDRDEVKENHSVTVTLSNGKTHTGVNKKLTGMTTNGNDSVSISDAAMLLGYDSGAEMMTDLLESPTLAEEVKLEAEAEMKRIHGDILSDGSIEAEADLAMQNEERAKLMLAELKTLSKGSRRAPSDAKAIRELAEDYVDTQSFKDLNPAKYRKAELKAAAESAVALANGDKSKAAEAKLRQVQNFYLNSAATKAKNDMMKGVKFVKRYNKKNIRELIQRTGNGYWEQIVKVMNRFEFRKSMKAVDESNETLAAWLASREADGETLSELSAAVLDETYSVHWKKVSYSEFKGVVDSLKNLEHVARNTDKITRGEEELDFDKVVTDLVEHTAVISGRYETRSEKGIDADVENEGWFARANAQMSKMGFVTRWLDNKEKVGMYHQLFMQRFTDALHDKYTLHKDITVDVMEKLQNHIVANKKRMNAKFSVKGLKGEMTGSQAIAVALNTGNKGNLEKMLRGEGWITNEQDASLDNEILVDILSRLTVEDAKLVQMIWSEMDKLYPLLNEVYKRSQGVELTRVESSDVTLAGVELVGGYYPVVYSKTRSNKAAKLAEKKEDDIDSMFSRSGLVTQSVRAGASNARSSKYHDKIRLNLDTIPNHFEEVIHYVTHHDAVRQVNKLINDHRVEDAIAGAIGQAEFDNFRPWLSDIAKDGKESMGKDWIESTFQHLRSGVTLTAMGFKASTGIMQLFGIFNTANEVGYTETFKAVLSTVGHSNYLRSLRTIFGDDKSIISAWDFAMKHSKVLPHRIDTMDRETRNLRKTLKDKSSKYAKLQNASMWHIATVQTYMVDLPTWTAAFNKVAKESGDEVKAAQYADWVVESIQGSGATKDMAKILRNQNKVTATMTMFMTFFSSLGNITRSVARDVKYKQISPQAFTATVMTLYVIPVMVEMLLRGEFEGEDDDEIVQKTLTKIALYPVTSVPFVRDAVGALVTDYQYNFSPVASILEKGVDGYKQVWEDGEDVSAYALKSATKLSATVAQLPGAGQLWATGEHLYDVIEEGEDLALRGLIYGPKK